MSTLVRRPSSWCLSWYCAPGCPKHANGGKQHFVSLRTKDRRLAEKYQKDKDAATEQHRARILLGLASSSTVTKNWTLAQFTEAYGDKVTTEQLVCPATWERAERCALRSLQAFRPAAYLRDLDATWIAAYQAFAKPRLSAYSWKSRRATLRGIGTRAVSWGWLAANPFNALSPITPARKLPKRLQQEQIPMVLAAIPNPLWRLVTLFFYATGVRLGELCRLRREHVRSQQGYLEIEINKEKKPKKIALTPEIRAILTQAAALSRSPYVFSRDGKPLHPEAVKTYYRWISKKVGFKVSPHRFRHSHGVHRVEAGDNLRTVADTLGHADIRTTANFYMDFDLPAQRLALSRLPIDELLTIDLPAKKSGQRPSKTVAGTP